MTLILSGTDGLSDVDGTAATPAIRGTDTNTGIFFPAADTIAFSEGGVESMRLDSSGNLLVGTTSASTPGTGFISVANTFGFKNRIINGGMTVWQRGTSFSAVTPSLGVSAYTADRWYVAQLFSQSATDVSQQTTGSTRFAIRVQKRSGSTGASSNILGQVIENLNCLDLPGQQVTLSFTARAGANYSATSNNLAVQIFTCTAADQSSQSFVNGTATGQATLLSQNVTLTTSNQRFTLTTNAVASNATNICLQFFEASSASAAGANDWFEISDVQLERGSTATSFDYRPYGTELMLCQRYYFRVSGGVASILAFGGSQSTTVASAVTQFQVPMRAAPTALDQSGTASQYEIYYTGTVTTCNSVPAFQSANQFMANATFAVASGLTAGHAVQIRATSTSAYLGWSAEL